MRRLRTLVSAYACEPNKGSEPGVGWNLAVAMAMRHDVWVLTRANNRLAIEEELKLRPVNGLHFLYYDLPRWARWWKRGSRGVQAYYYLWQLGAIKIARAAHSELSFDLAHHATFGKYWAPATAAFVGIPFIWGPIGGGVSMPKAFIQDLSARSWLYERSRLVARYLGERDPVVLATARQARIAIATTPETSEKLRRLVRCPVVEMLEVALNPANFPEQTDTVSASLKSKGVLFVSAGRLLGLKGYHLAIRAFARAKIPSATYAILGEGPERQNLEKLVRALGVRNQVSFVGAVPRAAVLDRLGSADVFVHPSLHDSGGWATLEAMAAGLPVICIGIGGPAVQVNSEVGRVVMPNDVNGTIEKLAGAMRELANDSDLRHRLGVAARHRVRTKFTWARKVDELSRLYEKVVKDF